MQRSGRNTSLAWHIGQGRQGQPAKCLFSSLQRQQTAAFSCTEQCHPGSGLPEPQHLHWASRDKLLFWQASTTNCWLLVPSSTSLKHRCLRQHKLIPIGVQVLFRLLAAISHRAQWLCSAAKEQDRHILQAKVCTGCKYVPGCKYIH